MTTVVAQLIALFCLSLRDVAVCVIVWPGRWGWGGGYHLGVTDLAPLLDGVKSVTAHHQPHWFLWPFLQRGPLDFPVPVPPPLLSPAWKAQQGFIFTDGEQKQHSLCFGCRVFPS